MNRILSALALASTLFVAAPALAAEVTPSGEGAIIVGARIADFTPSAYGSYFDWGQGRDGYGYCYEWTSNGYVLNGGQPVGNYNCESRNPSYFDWGRGRDGWAYCYRMTPNGFVMNQGQPAGNFNCEATNPSYYAWGRGQDGYAYCYQYAPNGIAMNQGRPVGNFNCR